MPTYPIHIAPQQIVRWLLAEQKTTPSLFRFDARRTTEVRDIPRTEYHLDDEEREDLHEVETIATLELRPAPPSDGWLLKITVEDELGPHMAGVTDQQIDLDTFYNQFIRPGRVVTMATALVQDAVAERHLDEMLGSILVNRHATSAKA